MKKIFNILLLSVSLFAFASCGDDDDDKKSEDKGRNSQQTEESYQFSGLLTVSNGYTQQDVEMNLKYNDSLSAYVFTFKEVTFSEKMPYVQKVELRLDNYTIDNGDTVYKADKVVPYWHGSPIDFMTLTNFRAVVSKDSLNFTAQGGEDSSEGGSSMNYNGIRKK